MSKGDQPTEHKHKNVAPEKESARRQTELASEVWIVGDDAPPHTTQWSLIFFGLLDSINLSFFAKCVLGRQKIRRTFGWCCCLNFLVAAGSVLVLQWVQWALHLCYALLGGGEQMLEDKLTQVLLMGLTHTILWKVPLYLVSYPLNYVWLCEIFDEAYRELYACNKKEGAASYSAVLDKMTDSLMQALLLALVMVQTEAIRYAAGIPLFIVGLFFGRGDEAWAVGRALTMPVALCYEAWAYSFYAFGSRLDQQPNVTLQKKIVYFQARWMYFLGFGLPPVALLAYVASYDAFLSTVLYFVILPVHAVLSVPAHPEKQQAYDPLPIFKHAGFLLSAVLPLLHAQFRL